jgi:hypothetical protein
LSRTNIDQVTASPRWHVVKRNHNASARYLKCDYCGPVKACPDGLVMWRHDWR